MLMKKSGWTTKFWYAMIQIMLWGGYGVIICYCSNFLKSMNFHDSHVSIVMGTASALAIIVQLGLAELIQKIRAFTTSGVIAVQGAVILVAGILMLQNKGITAAAVLGIGVGCVALQTLPSLSNSLATESEQAGYPVNFPVARGMGSLAYSVFSFITGRLIGSTGIQIVAFLTVGTGAILCAAAILFQMSTGKKDLSPVKMVTTVEVDNATSEKRDTSVKTFFGKYSFLFLFLAGSILFYISHNLVSTFMQQITEAKGAGAGEQGTAIAIAGVLELPAMFGFSWLLKKTSCGKLVRFSGLCFLMKAVIILLAPDYHWLYVAQIFQMGGFALYTVGSVEYVGSAIAAEDAVRAQTYLATTMTAGSLIATYFGGFICQYAGVSVMVGTSAVLALMGFLLICRATRKQQI